AVSQSPDLKSRLPVFVDVPAHVIQFVILIHAHRKIARARAKRNFDVGRGGRGIGRNQSRNRSVRAKRKSKSGITKSHFIRHAIYETARGEKRDFLRASSRRGRIAGRKLNG